MPKRDRERSAVFWIDGGSYVFRGEEVTNVLRLAAAADTKEEAWRVTEAYGKHINTRR